MASDTWALDRGASFYLAFAAAAAVAALVGFSTTYFIPVAGGRFSGPLVAHLHGLLFFGWIGLFATQAILARSRAIGWHRKLGAAALPLAAAMAATGVGVGMFAVRRDLGAGVGEFAYSQLVGVVTTMLWLLILVSAALLARRQPDWHKRLMILATVAVLWPAWFRWRHLLPMIPRPDIWLGVVVPDSLIVIAAARDLLKFGRVHPAYLWFGLPLISENILEVLSFDSPAWRVVAKALFALFSPVF